MNAIRTALGVLGVSACLVPGLARAETKDLGKYQMLWSQDTRRNKSDGTYSRDTEKEVRIQVEVSSSRKVSVLDSGTASQHIYNKFGGIRESTQESAKWSNTWSGTASLSGEVMTLDLKLASRQCTYEKATDKQPAKPLPCEKVSEQLRLVCKMEQVPLAGQTGKPQGSVTAPAWVCEPEGQVSLFGTPSRWVLGRESCVRVIAETRFTEHYERCNEPRK